jgi:hypothetical protein
VYCIDNIADVTPAGQMNIYNFPLVSACRKQVNRSAFRRTSSSCVYPIVSCSPQHSPPKAHGALPQAPEKGRAGGQVEKSFKATAELQKLEDPSASPRDCGGVGRSVVTRAHAAADARRCCRKRMIPHIPIYFSYLKLNIETNSPKKVGSDVAMKNGSPLFRMLRMQVVV